MTSNSETLPEHYNDRETMYKIQNKHPTPYWCQLKYTTTTVYFKTKQKTRKTKWLGPELSGKW